MSQQFHGRVLLALFISISLIACKGKGKGEETTGDTTTTTQTKNPADMDAVKVAPNLYKVLADTMGIRIVEVNYQPGDSSAMHWHPDYAVYAVDAATATFTTEDGSKMENNLPAGTTMIAPAGFHSVKNTGSNPVHVILFEVNRTGQMGSVDAAMDATKVSPGIYTLKNDSLGIRVIEVNFKPGAATGKHSHPDAALYVVESGTAEFTGNDGNKRVMELTKGMALIVPADTHIVKNVGKTTAKVILVEVNRSM